ncbi:MAG TPA: glycosyltransferase family 1 protein [Gallionellaceae bacterium]|nr:glycosyltransferase family 1 protein [Gallionellaceae bacterium]
MTTTPHIQLHSASAPLNIAMVTETYPPEVNGVAITVARMVEGMRLRQHHVQLIRPRQHKLDVAAHDHGYAEILVAGMPLPGYAGLKAGLPARGRLLRLWQQNRPDVVHIATEGPLGWSAMSAARKLGIPVATDFHTNFHSYSKHYGAPWLFRPIAAYLRYFHNKTDCTMVPTTELQEELQRKGYKNVDVVSRGVDTTLFHPSRRSTELRRQWGAADDTPVVMLVSRLAAEKNLHVVIHAFEQMRVVAPDAKLVMVGDGPARAALQEQYPQVIFAGMRTGEDLAAHYASGDVFLYPSLTETYGNVTVEAMASGLAVLAYDYAAARQHIRHDINGLLAPFDDSTAFIDQAVALIGAPTRVQRLRAHARHSVEALTWENIMAQLESVLLRLVHAEGDNHVQTELSAATD